jgi:hypothetical protein
MSELIYEPVLTVHDWWDGPRAGVANFGGKPHLYISSWDDAADDWSEVFTLAPLDQDTLRLVLEDYEIWRRWRLAFDAGQVAADSGPALPEDKPRSAELKEILQPLFKGTVAPSAHARPSFRRRADANPLKDPYGLEVHWRGIR